MDIVFCHMLWWCVFFPLLLFPSFSFFFFSFLLVKATHAAYGGSQARGRIRATAAGLQHRIWATSVTYTTAHGNARFLTHWARAGIKPATSWFLVGFLSTEPQRELLYFSFVNVLYVIDHHPWELRMNPTWSWCMIFFMHVGFGWLKFCWEFCICSHQRY